MTLDALYESCVGMDPEAVRAVVGVADTVPAAEVRRVYATLGCRTRRTVADMRRVIRSAILERMGTYHRVEV